MIITLKRLPTCTDVPLYSYEITLSTKRLCLKKTAHTAIQVQISP
jgi:hypothetical protein